MNEKNVAAENDVASEVAAVASGISLKDDDYKVDLEIFEGPLDLLLYLIRKDELDIYDIPISRVTQQYLEYLEIMKLLDLNIAGEFLMMAATLMLIKSKTLLPPEERVEDEDEEEIDDPRLDLVRQLLEYKKFKEVAAELQQLEIDHSKTFARIEDEIPLADQVDKRLVDVGIFDLLTAFSNVLKRTQAEEPTELIDDDVRVGDQIVMILQRLEESGQANFSSFFDRLSSRMMIAVTFLAMLELMKQRRIAARQRKPFSEIEIILREGEDDGVV